MRPALAVCGAAVLLGVSAAAHAAPSFAEVRRDFRSSETRVVDRDGVLLQRLRTDASMRRGQWVALDDVSPALRSAMLLSEDRRFYEHSGVDWRAVSAAAWGRLWHQRTRGASTLTMQLAGLLDADLGRGGGRDMAQKLGQAVTAQQLERGWRKDQILEAYLNLVPFRGELVGIDALSRTLFGKAAHGLDAREAAVAAALVRAPNATPAAVARRACAVLAEMEPGPKPDCIGIDLFAQAALQRRGYDASEGIAPHLARVVVRGGTALVPSLSPAERESPSQPSKQALPPGDIRTTLSAPLQRFAVQALDRQLRELKGRHVEDGAVVVLDNASGAVLAWVGSSGALSRAAEVDGVLALRQPGSTLKPFLYGEAIAERRLTAASLLLDSPEQIATASGLYVPQNYDRRFKGTVSARTALAASLNVPAVRTLVMVSPDAFFAQLQAVGLPLRESGGYFGYSLALGSAEVSLLQLTNAYRTLANGGMASGTRVLAEGATPGGTAPSAHRALDAGAAFVVGDILSDPNARARTFGTDSVLSTRFWTAVKTGTSKDMRDNWAVGWSQRYTVGVWVGNAAGGPMWDVSGVSGAAPVWAAVMGELHRRQPSRAPAPPPGVVQAAVRFGDALEAPRTEWFLAGTEQPLFAMDSIAGGRREAPAAGTFDPKNAASGPAGGSPGSAPPRIVAPVDGTIVALDPDIPPRHQRVRLQAAGGGALRWQVDGTPLARGTEAGWLPWPGRHRIQLVDAAGRVQDEARIEVRGAGVR
ncbi:penicillin-binding protein 1C [Xylophilus sp. Leaf220]|nr:penicillin-binding protein 1C [Xylophilus sp. Leaf220]